MEICRSCPSISAEDIRAAQKELKTYVDVTEEDLMKIYVLAVRHARERHSTAVPVSTVMTGKVFYVSADMDVRKAVGLLSINRISGMPVVDDQNKVVGVISEADISSSEGGKKKHSLLGNLFGAGRTGEGKNRLVKEAMSSPAITTGPEADIREVAEVLDMHRIKRLPVVDDQGKLIGIISRGDIIRSMGGKR